MFPPPDLAADIRRLRRLIAHKDLERRLLRNFSRSEGRQTKSRRIEWNATFRRFQSALEQHEEYRRKAGFNPAQPRVPPGNPDGGQWTGDGGATLRPVLFDPRGFAVQKAIEAALALFTWLSARNGPEKQAIITFSAKQFRPDGRGELDLDDVQLLDRDQLDAACPRLGEVQDRPDIAAATVRRGPYLPPQDFGTAVHTNLKRQIVELHEPNFRAEVSYVKNIEENYGKKLDPHRCA